MMRIKVCQLVYGEYAEPDSWFQYVEIINRSYCKLHGYEYVVERLAEHGQKNRHGNWAKVAHIKRHLDNCDFLFFLDADACFYCFQIAIHEEILPFLPDEKSILACVNKCGEDFRWGDEPSAGVFLIRNNKISHQILEDWDKSSDLPEFERSRWEWPVEQIGLADCVYPKHKDHFQLHKEYYQIHSLHGYFIRHVFAVDMSDRHEHRNVVFREILESPMMKRNSNLMSTK